MTIVKKTKKPDLSRRDALKRLGLAVGAAYMTPTLLSLSNAHASSGASGGGGGGGSSSASAASAASAASTASSASSPSSSTETTGGANDPVNCNFLDGC